MKLTERIREQLIASGASRNKVHKSTGLTRATISAFIGGKDVHSSTIDAIAEFLGAEIMFTSTETKSKAKR